MSSNKAPQTDEERAAARARRKEREMQRERAEQEAVAAEQTRRQQQLALVSRAHDELGASLEKAEQRQQDIAALVDHAEGFYEEVEKLSNRKSVFEVTNLSLQQANTIIREAKVLVVGDPHLDRVQEFGPAVENPAYPDILVCLRNVLRSLGRAEPRFAAETEAINRKRVEASTIHTALALIIADHEPASRRDVKVRLRSIGLAKDWFVKTGDRRYFDYRRLDKTDLTAALRPSGDGS